jgi:copper chaperone CopZ
MTAIHLRTRELASDWTSLTVEATLQRMAGVAKVAVIRSMGLVSVLFDERHSSADQILGAMRDAGVDAQLYPRRGLR